MACMFSSKRRADVIQRGLAGLRVDGGVLEHDIRLGVLNDGKGIGNREAGIGKMG